MHERFIRASRLAPLALLALLGSCATSGAEFAEQQAGFAVTKGEILRVDDLSSAALERLADGVAFEVAAPGCRVSLSFADGERSELALPPGCLIVCSGSGDYVLRREGRAAEPDAAETADG
ncbi:MAG: hypothetical protein AAF628_18790 [Planctomycetota bacterium]